MEKNLNKHMYKFVQTLWKIFCQFSLKNNLALRPSNSILRHIFNRNTCLCVIKKFCKKIKKILEKEMATHSSILAWRIPQTEEPGGPQSLPSQRVEHSWSDLAHMYAYTIDLQYCVPAVQQSESAVCLHASPRPCSPLPFRSPQSTEQSSLCNTVGSH